MATIFEDNFNTPGWENITSDNGTGANIDFNLTGEILSNLSNYYNPGNWVVCRVYQHQL